LHFGRQRRDRADARDAVSGIPTVSMQRCRCPKLRNSVKREHILCND
jgi:hypothetical protein